MEKRRIKQFTTPKINSLKLVKHIQIFNYLVEFSVVEIERLSPNKRLTMIHDYIDSIVLEFYQWNYKAVLKSKTECTNLSCSVEGERKILEGLHEIQNNLLFSITNFIWFIRNRINGGDLSSGLIGFEINVGVSYNYDTDDFESKCILKNNNSVFKNKSIVEIFAFIIIQLLTIYSIDRFILCEQCGKLFFNRSLIEKRFCCRKCADVLKMERFKSKNKD